MIPDPSATTSSAAPACLTSFAIAPTTCGLVVEGGGRSFKTLGFSQDTFPAQAQSIDSAQQLDGALKHAARIFAVHDRHQPIFHFA